ASKLLLWASPIVNLSTGLPSMFQTATAGALVRAAVWLAAAAATLGCAVWIDRRRTRGESAPLAIGLTGAVSAIVAISIVWTMNGVQPLLPSQAGARLLRAVDGDAHQVA